jgi:hypothetical protein
MSDMPDPNSASPAADELQFEKAEFVAAQPDLRCAFCQSPLSNTYYQVAGAVTCPACAEQRRIFQTPPEGSGTFLKAMFYGLGAAVLGSIIYAGARTRKKHGIASTDDAYAIGLETGSCVERLADYKSNPIVVTCSQATASPRRRVCERCMARR